MSAKLTITFHPHTSNDMEAFVCIILSIISPEKPGNYLGKLKNHKHIRGPISLEPIVLLSCLK